MLEITAGPSKAVEMFTALDRAFPPGPPDVPALVRVLGDYGVKVGA